MYDACGENEKLSSVCFSTVVVAAVRFFDCPKKNKLKRNVISRLIKWSVGPSAYRSVSSDQSNIRPTQPIDYELKKLIIEIRIKILCAVQ